MDDNLEYVQGISRHHEMLWIERGDDGKIKQVYDVEKKPVEITRLSHSCIIEVVNDNGFIYRGEYIPFEGIREELKMRALGYQRHKSAHRKSYMDYVNKKK